MQTIWLVIPCYNEEDVIKETASRLYQLLKSLIDNKKISVESKISMINDGSTDNTWNIIQDLCNSDAIYVGINLSRNKGHQNALLAGLMTAKDYTDATISLDADLQDDITVIEKFINKYIEGNDIVYGVRSSRNKDSFFKRFTAESFYKFMRLLGVDIVYNHADYRLLSKRVLNELAKYKEVNLFLRGMIPQIGFPSTTVQYERKERFAGKSNYPLKKMLSFAFEGITSFSIKPIRFITNLGLFIFTLSIIMLIYSFIQYFCGNTVSGWSSLIISIWSLGGLQLLSIGIIGEYIGKTYLESKNRPKYSIEKIVHNKVKVDEYNYS